MPLNLSQLQTDLTSLFASPPDTFASCAQEWADALQNYSIAIVPPSTQVSAASSALQTSLAATFSTSTDANVTAVQMEAAFLQFATTVGLGMQPTFTAVPPTLQVGFSTLFSATPPPATAEAAAAQFANSIDTWMRTGTATRNSPPFDTVTWL